MYLCDLLLLLVSYLVNSSTLKIEVIYSSETSGSLRTTWRLNPMYELQTQNIKCLHNKSQQCWTSEKNGCIILCVANLADDKFNEVSRMKFLGTVVHRLTELLPNHCQH
jgi:hypothetical protein